MQIKRYPNYPENHQFQIIDQYEVVTPETWDNLPEFQQEIFQSPTEGTIFAKKLTADFNS